MYAVINGERIKKVRFHNFENSLQTVYRPRMAKNNARVSLVTTFSK